MPSGFDPCYFAEARARAGSGRRSAGRARSARLPFYSFLKMSAFILC
ncbi:MAG: hypothetical protein HSCHL_1197 [Hydrogenibacillus schlegelii]|uniref:Uncharacterized protein n=1 Tax=Hydrogenibacillus schlegelii TaxID=1484 RepID=A0A2T5G3F5_HYDSH|nr:MAG: hypothetical protein HSCHL_1197 [Hydrogenibacillus schlegelii]